MSGTKAHPSYALNSPSAPLARHRHAAGRRALAKLRTRVKVVLTADQAAGRMAEPMPAISGWCSDASGLRHVADEYRLAVGLRASRMTWSSGSASSTCTAAEPQTGSGVAFVQKFLVIFAESDVVLFEVEDHGYSRQVEAVREKVDDPVEPVDVVGTVKPGPPAERDGSRRPLRSYRRRFCTPVPTMSAVTEMPNTPWSLPSFRPPARTFLSFTLALFRHECYIKDVSATTDSGERTDNTIRWRWYPMLMRTDPFRELDRLTQQVFGTAARTALMTMDAWQDHDQFIVEFDLPGVDANSIDLDVERNVLTVRADRPALTRDQELVAAERPRGVFSRQLILGDNLDTDHITASYETASSGSNPRGRESQAPQDHRQVRRRPEDHQRLTGNP